ncbi:MAG: DUF4236 domain-containing protein [Candidatus Kapaibacterium sp.]
MVQKNERIQNKKRNNLQQGIEAMVPGVLGIHSSPDETFIQPHHFPLSTIPFSIRMGIRFRKYINILPGVRLNLSKSGVSTRIGPRGLSVNIGKRGTYLNAGIPGTGIFEREKLSTTGDHPHGELHSNGQAPEVPRTMREKLSHVPIKSIVFFFITLIAVGFLRRGYVAAFWIVGWLAYLGVRLAFAVKQRVEERQVNDRSSTHMPKN